MKIGVFVVAALHCSACTLLEPPPRFPSSSLVSEARSAHIDALVDLVKCASAFAGAHADSKLTATELSNTAVDSCAAERFALRDAGVSIALLGYPGGVDRVLCHADAECLEDARVAHRVALATARSKVMELIAVETTPED